MPLFDRFRRHTPLPLPDRGKGAGGLGPSRLSEHLSASTGEDEPPPPGQSSWGYQATPRTDRPYGRRSYAGDVEKAWELYTTNPLAQRIIQIRVEHIIDDNTKPVAKDKRVQQVLDRFWHDPINRLPELATQLAEDLLIFGTQVVPLSVNRVPLGDGFAGDGLVRLAYLDPSTLKDIHLDPGNVRLPTAVELKPPSGFGQGRLLRVVQPDTVPGSPTHGLLASGECFLSRVNHPINAKFGRSDLLIVEKWLEQSTIFFTDLVQHIYWLTNFVWDVQIEQATDAILKARKNEVRANPPARGSVLLHNEREKWTAVTPDLRQEDISSASRTLIWWIAGIGAGIPEHWLGWGRETTRATAKEMQSPTLHMLEKRQRAVRAMLSQMCLFQIHQAIVAKTLPADVDQSFEVLMPDLTPPDVPALAAAFRDLTEALSTDVAQQHLRPELAAQLLDRLATIIAVAGPSPSSVP